jgi:hypothetical protein
MGGFPHAPGPLVVAGITGVFVGGLLLLVLAWHVLRRIMDVPRVPLGPAVYALLLLICAATLGGGLLALVLAAALEDWQTVPEHAAVAEVRCQRDGAAVKVTLVPIASDGSHGPAETAAATTAPCDLTIERLAFAPPLSRVLGQRQRVTSLAGRPRPGETPAWRALPRPLGLNVAEASDHQLRLTADETHPYRVMVEGPGFRVERQ